MPNPVSFYMYADVVFPLKLHPLTYSLPPDAPSDALGRIVNAPLMGRTSYGIITAVSIQPPAAFKKAVRPITQVLGRFGSKANLPFLKWLSGYYLSPEGLALKSCFFDETVKALVKNGLAQSAKQPVHGPGHETQSTAGSHLPASLSKALDDNSYRTFLFHAPSPSLERRMLCEALEKALPSLRGFIIMVPEIGQINGLASMVGDIAGDRLCILHGKLTPRKRLDAVNRIIHNASDIIIGTRSAVFAPLEKVSLISVLDEHSHSYKAEEGLRYGARDAAVMRGFLEKATVLLSSTCPSLESVHNSHIGKYTQLDWEQEKDSSGQPLIRLIAVKSAGRNKISISPEILKKAKETLDSGERFLFLSGRKGYSLIRCEDCGEIASCGKCRVNLVYLKGKGLLRCSYCGLERKVYDTCPKCGSVRLVPVGTGTERLRDELRDALNTEPLLPDDVRKGPGQDIKTAHSPLGHIMELAPEMVPFVVGTPRSAGKTGKADFSAAALLDIDMMLSLPDFRAYEKTFQEVIRIADTVVPDGALFLQTRDPGNAILKFIRERDFRGFQDQELTQRRVVAYPPFSRIILFNIFVEKDSPGLMGLLEKALVLKPGKHPEVLGPQELPSTGKNSEKRIQIVLKSRDKKLVHEAAWELLGNLAKIGGIRVVTDVDPYRI